MPRLYRSVAFAASLAIPGGLLSAQVVRGRVLEDGSDRPLSGAVVFLRDATGLVIGSAVTAPNGVFRVPGRQGTGFRLTAEMIGHRTFSSESLALLSSDTLEFTIRLPVLAIPLDEIRSETGNRCARLAELTPVTNAMWQEVKKALTAERAFREEGGIRFQLETFEREVLSDSQVIARDRRQRTTSRSPEAFRSVALDQLDVSGFVAEQPGGDYLLGPSPTVLLANWFESTHCLSLVRGNDDAELGVGFAPNSERDQPEITGTLWLDAATYRLKRADFTYVSLPPRIPAGNHGRLTLEHLAGGVVVITFWVISSPIIELSEVRTFGQRRPVERVVAVLETGGEILRATVGSDTLYQAPRGRIRGFVRDSVNGTVLGNARVFLVGSSFSARTDSTGYYELPDLPAGVYRISFDHPRVAAFGFRHDPKRVEVVVGAAAGVDMAIPPGAKLLVSAEEIARLDTIAAVSSYLGLSGGARNPSPDERQRASVARDRPATILGRVIDHNSNGVIRNAEIVLIPLSQAAGGARITARTDENGVFEIPEVAAGDYDVAVSKAEYAPLEPLLVTLEQGLDYDWVIRLRRR